MGYRRVLLDINCNGHVSGDTFNEFLEIVESYADDLFDGEVSIASAIETENDEDSTEKIREWLRESCPYNPYKQSPSFLKPEFEHEPVNCYDGYNPRLEDVKRKQLLEAIKEVRKYE